MGTVSKLQSLAAGWFITFLVFGNLRQPPALPPVSSPGLVLVPGLGLHHPGLHQPPLRLHDPLPGQVLRVKIFNNIVKHEKNKKKQL